MSETKLVEYVYEGDSALLRTDPPVPFSATTDEARLVVPTEPYQFEAGKHYDWGQSITNTADLTDLLNLPRWVAPALKYICRAGKKPGEPPERDYKKAIKVLWRHVYGTWPALPQDTE